MGHNLMHKAETFLFQRHQKIWLETAEAIRASGFYETFAGSP
nr:hypothetical protein [Pseudomonas sp. SWRI51]